MKLTFGEAHDGNHDMFVCPCIAFQVASSQTLPATELQPLPATCHLQGAVDECCECRGTL